MRLRDLVHPDDALGLEAMRDQLLGGEPALEGLHRFVRKNESVFYGRVQATAVRDDTGSLSYFLGVFEDVTAEIEATSALKASEARLRAIIDNSPDIIAVLYPSGHWEASRQSTRLLGYPNGYVVDGGLYALIHPDDGPTAAVALSEVLAGTRSPKEPIELRLRAFDGNYWTFECVGQNLGSDDVDGGVVVTARNVTERKRAERAHREAEERFRTAFEHSPLCVSLVDLDGRILDINAAGAALLQQHARGADRNRCARLCAPGRRRARDRSDVAADLRHRRDRGVPHGARRRNRSLGDVARRPLHARGRSSSVRHLAPDRHHRAAQPRGASREGSHHGSAHGVAEPQRVHEPRSVGVGAQQQGGGRAAVPRPRPVQGRERHVRARRR